MTTSSAASYENFVKKIPIFLFQWMAGNRSDSAATRFIMNASAKLEVNEINGLRRKGWKLLRLIGEHEHETARIQRSMTSS